MAHWVKFSIAFAFGAAGLWAFGALPGWWALAGFIGLFFAGSVLAHLVFKKIATPEQIREDLEARLQSD